MESLKKFYKECQETKTREEMTHYYDSWSMLYEKELNLADYRGPFMVANALAALYPEDRENVHVLDVAAGTGFVGEQLAKQGFVQIDALDPSEGMLAQAKEKGIYQTLICEYLDGNQLDIAAGSYDVITISGACNNGHLTCECLLEVVRLVKQGGFFVLCTRPCLLNRNESKQHFETWMDDIEKEGKWKMVRKDILPKYLKDEDGIIFVYQMM
ncbi:methyltransferase-like protein 27 [Pecten maximus]|uniref:methyltransferase-like protein 27 n=1 Tax=Pecten maximus TaxID=6579 RepID=UPI001458901B|nr:methyltransferase-like protein 27 [Pecten maximus]